MIIIYTTQTCPKCKILRKRLAEKGLDYEEFTDEEKMIEMGIQSVPVMSVDGELMDFPKALQYLNER